MIGSSRCMHLVLRRFLRKRPENHRCLSQSSTVDEGEVDRFSKIADQWWNPSGKYAALHTMNQLRVPLVVNSVSITSACSAPLAGMNILDVGCGGGILSVPLARLGAKVIGLDASPENIEAAGSHKESMKDPDLLSNLSYVCTTVEEFASKNESNFDVIVASEVVEHVNSLELFLKACVQMTKSGGSLVFTTLNKTQLSYWLAVIGAENILGLVPQGTHDWNKFVEPTQLKTFLEQNNCRCVLIHGMFLNPLTLRWSWCTDTSINYAARFVKH